MTEQELRERLLAQIRRDIRVFKIVSVCAIIIIAMMIVEMCGDEKSLGHMFWHWIGL